MERQSSRYAWIAYPQAYTCCSLPTPRVRHEPYALRSNRQPYERKGGEAHASPPFFFSTQHNETAALLSRRGATFTATQHHFHRDAARHVATKAGNSFVATRHIFHRDAARHVATRAGALARFYHLLGEFTYRAPFPMLVIQDIIAKFAVVRFIR